MPIYLARLPNGRHITPSPIFDIPVHLDNLSCDTDHLAIFTPLTLTDPPSSEYAEHPLETNSVLLSKLQTELVGVLL